MSRRRNRGAGTTARTKGKQTNGLGDVTINDYANNTVAVNRVQKGKTAVATTTTTVDKVIDEEIAVDIINDDLSDDGSNKVQKKRRNKKFSNTNDDDENHIYNSYHIDIWFLISEYIEPEDVSRFSLICQQTAAICATAKFWFGLYKKYYHQPDIPINIPIRLQPECMVRIGGLRACVIRSLFYTYKPFVHRLKSLANKDFHDLAKQQLITHWFKNNKEHWNYCYKFKKKLIIGGRLAQSEELGQSDRKMKILKDIYNNPEEGCTILVIKTTGFIPMPANIFASGSVFLNSIHQNLSKGFTNYKLTLNFVNYRQEPISTIIYDPVVQIEVLNWWTPAYHTYLN